MCPPPRENGGAIWKKLVAESGPLLLPAAHDALTAKIIARSGFKAYQVGGFALIGARHAWPDVDIAKLAEELAGVRDTIAPSDLPVCVDGDDGYGDVKSIHHMVTSYAALGVSALFMEDQKSPKRCGHMENKEVVSVDEMVDKLHAAHDARKSADQLYLIARTDARQPEGLKKAIKRAERYAKEGADVVYVEGIESREELEEVGKALSGISLTTTILENGGKTPWVPPVELYQMGYRMVLYPTTVLFRVARAIEKALLDLHDGRELDKNEAVDMNGFELIVDKAKWADIEKRYGRRQ